MKYGKLNEERKFLVDLFLFFMYNYLVGEKLVGDKGVVLGF